jgi:excinuclease ABC subunit A
VERQTPQQIVDRILELDEGTRFQVLAPVVRGRKGEYEGLLSDLAKQGFARARIDGEVRELTEEIKLDRYYQHTIEVVVDRLVRKEGMEQRLTQSLETALTLTEGTADIEIEDGATLTFSQHLACSMCGLSFEDLQPRNFSFNSPYGACPVCSGIGTKFQVDPELVIADPELSLEDGAIPMWSSNRMRYYHRLLTGLGEVFGFSMGTPWQDLSPEIKEKILYGTGEEKVTIKYTNRFGRKRQWQATFEGAIPFLNRRHESAESDSAREYYQEYMATVPCEGCGGGRLNPISMSGAGQGVLRDRRVERAGDHHRRAGTQRGSGQDSVPARRGSRLSESEPIGRHPGRGRGAADQAGNPDRVGSGGSPIHPGRAVDRSPPARQPTSHRDPASSP